MEEAAGAGVEVFDRHAIERADGVAAVGLAIVAGVLATVGEFAFGHGFEFDLEALLGTDTKGLAAAQRRLARRLQAKFPLGVQA